MKYLLLLFSLLLSSQLFALSNHDLPRSYGAIGDSITAAAIASHSRKSSIFPDEGMLLVIKLFKQAVNGDNYGNDDLDDKYLSWATGVGKKKNFSSKRVFGHRYFINQLFDKDTTLISKNFSISGSIAKNVLDYQIPRLLKWSQENLGQLVPDYTTILVGINDLCARKISRITPIHEYYFSMKEIVQTILSSSDSSKILILSLPRVQNLRIQMRNSRVFGVLKCKKMWKAASICPIFNDPKNIDELETALDFWEEYNLVLEHVTEEMRTIYGDRIRISKKISEIYFNKNDLAIDCFHPDSRGQQKISDESWKATWWN